MGRIKDTLDDEPLEREQPERSVRLEFTISYLRRMDRSWKRRQYGNRTAYLKDLIRRDLAEDEEKVHRRGAEMADRAAGFPTAPRVMSTMYPGKPLTDEKKIESIQIPVARSVTPQTVTVISADAIALHARSLHQYLSTAPSPMDRSAREAVVGEMILGVADQVQREALAKALDDLIAANTEKTPEWMKEQPAPAQGVIDRTLDKVNDAVDDFWGKRRVI